MAEAAALRTALETAHRELGEAQVDAGRVKVLEREVSEARRGAREARERAEREAEETRRRLEEARRRASALEASTNEAKRALGEVLGGYFDHGADEEDVPLAVYVRRAVDALEEARASASARNAEAMRNASKKSMNDDEDDEERELEAETEAALTEALGAARRWKSTAERERASREALEDELAALANEVKSSRALISRLRTEKEDADRHALDVERVIETLADRVRSLEKATDRTVFIDE